MRGATWILLIRRLNSCCDVTFDDLMEVVDQIGSSGVVPVDELKILQLRGITDEQLCEILKCPALSQIHDDAARMLLRVGEVDPEVIRLIEEVVPEVLAELEDKGAVKTDILNFISVGEYVEPWDFEAPGEDPLEVMARRSSGK